MDISFPMRKAKELKLGLDQNFGEGKSRICSLPDSILHHILSFLDLKEAVRTSVLSKRWEFLWTSVSKLEFKEDLKQSDEKREEFMDFVERALLLHDSSTLHTFSLTCKVPSNGPVSRVKSWIHAALGHKVQNMVLNLHFDNFHGSFMLPRHLFVSESLNELKLDFFYDLKLPSFVSFPSLKSLSLSKVIFMDDNSVNQLFSSCLNLVKLDLIQCKWYNLKHVYVSAPMLEHLKISESDDYEDTQHHCCKFMISGPRLKVFHYVGELTNEYCISEAPLLVDAHIDVYSGSSRTEREAADRAHKLFEGLATVKDLCVSSFTLEVLTDAEELVPSLPFFHDLNHLHLEVGTDDESLCHTCKAALLKILHNSPHLESIYFEPRMRSDMFSAQLDPVPPCFLTHLKKIKVDWSLGCEREVKELMAIIKSARVLERIELGYNYGATVNGAILDVLKGCIKSKVVFDRCPLRLLVDKLRSIKS
ncbi:hypothetical protein PTKIN_Ptkin14bG0225000 [Pterospermum kingtungense]